MVGRDEGEVSPSDLSENCFRGGGIDVPLRIHENAVARRWKNGSAFLMPQMRGSVSAT